MNDDAFTTAEQRGYSKGYAAGRKRGQKDRVQAERANERAEFVERVFLAVLPAIVASSWDQKEPTDKSSAKSKVACAWTFAREAAQQRNKKF